MTEHVGRPAYQRVADDLREKIASGELPVGSAIPSTAQLTRAYGVSSTVVRAAVGQLRGDGLLMGQPGKGVFVRSTPEAVAEHAASIGDLEKRVEDLHALWRAGNDRRGELEAEVTDLRHRVSAIEAELARQRAQPGKP